MSIPYTIDGCKVFRPDSEIFMPTNGGWERLYVKRRARVIVECDYAAPMCYDEDSTVWSGPPSTYRIVEIRIDGWSLTPEFEDSLTEDENFLVACMQYSDLFFSLDVACRLPADSNEPEVVGILIDTDYDGGKDFVRAKPREIVRHV